MLGPQAGIQTVKCPLQLPLLSQDHAQCRGGCKGKPICPSWHSLSGRSLRGNNEGSSLTLCSPGQLMQVDSHPQLWRETSASDLGLWIHLLCIWLVEAHPPRRSLLGKWSNLMSSNLESMMAVPNFSHPQNLPRHLMPLHWNKAMSLCNVWRGYLKGVTCDHSSTSLCSLSHKWSPSQQTPKLCTHVSAYLYMGAKCVT